jgi:type II secretion system protein I
MHRASVHAAGFTLVELLVAMALIAVIIPITADALRIATLAGEVSQRKELAARIGDKVINEAIVNGQSQFAGAGDEQSAGYQFHWVMKDQPFSQLNNLPVTATPNGVNQNGVNSAIIHEVSVDVTFEAQGKNFDVHLSTLVNMSQQ